MGLKIVQILCLFHAQDFLGVEASVEKSVVSFCVSFEVIDGFCGFLDEGAQCKRLIAIFACCIS